VLTLLPEAVWNSAVSVATEDDPVLLACVAYNFAAVATRRFHFIITRLTVERGNSSRVKYLSRNCKIGKESAKPEQRNAHIMF
jgi:hypothetical protein